MNDKASKPTIVPTLISSKGALWCVLLVGFFLAFWYIYNRYDACRAAEEELAKPVRTEVSTPYFSTRMPPGWKAWCTDGESVVMYRAAGAATPFVEVFVRKLPNFAYAALDANKMLLVRHIHERVAQHGLVNTNFTETVVEALGQEITMVKPGVSAVRIAMDIGPYDGETLVFIMGDVVYAVIGVCEDRDAASRQTVREFVRHVGEDMTFPDYRDEIERAVIDSSLITSEQAAREMAKSGSELALWRLFADRVEQEPEAALLPAITHFRESLQALSRIRREYQLVGTEDFARYVKFMEIRKAGVREWFVLLDKLIAMKDWEGARKQATFVIDHATLVDESLDRRRAAEKLSEIAAAEAAARAQAANGGK